MKLHSNITAYFIIWLLSLLFISFIGFSALPHSGKFTNDFLISFANWDGGHFLGIAEVGYSEKFQYAFFPLYPLTIRLVNEMTGNYFWAAILISVFSAFLGTQLLFKMISVLYDKKLSEKVIILILLFPTSFYFLTTYSEGLFFLLVVASFYFLRTNRLFLATVFASLASVTRLAGLALVLGLIVEVIITMGFSRKNWYVIFAPLGFLIYCWYLYSNMGDPFYFLVAELHWQRNITIPTVSFWETIKSLSQGGLTNNNFIPLLDLLFAVFGLGLAIRTFRFLPPSFSIYSIVSVLLPLFTPTLSSMPRFLLPIFPIFILLAQTKSKFLIFTYQLISIMLLSVFVTLFINGYWIS